MALMGVSVAGGFALSMSQKSAASARAAYDAPRGEMVASRVVNAAPEAVVSTVNAQVLTPLPAVVERLSPSAQTQTTVPSTARVIDHSQDGSQIVTRASVDPTGSLLAAPSRADVAPRARVVVPTDLAPAPAFVAPDFEPTVVPTPSRNVTLKRRAAPLPLAQPQPRVHLSQSRYGASRTANFPNTLIGVYR